MSGGRGICLSPSRSRTDPGTYSISPVRFLRAKNVTEQKKDISRRELAKTSCSENTTLQNYRKCTFLILNQTLLKNFYELNIYVQRDVEIDLLNLPKHF